MDTDEAYERELRSERDELLTAYTAVDSGPALLDFQLQLAAAIESREPAAFGEKSREAKEHLRLLRLLGDGLAWRFLHPYAIRQLAKNPAPPPALGNQGDGFRRTLHVAKEIAAAGHLVLVSDLSHCLAIGDLVICDDPERPSIVECGGHKNFLHRGRKARQLQRAQAVTDLLRDGTAVLSGSAHATHTLELTMRSDHTWAVVDRVVQAAACEGSASELASKDDFIFAIRADTDASAVAGIHEVTNHMAEPTFAIYTRVLERPHPRVPPCVAWDMSVEAQRVLYQGDVFVGHVVDAAAFVGRRRRNAEIVKVLRSGDAITGLGVVVADEPHAFSHEFFADVLLGFETIESTAEAILEGALATVDLAEPPMRPGEVPGCEECDRLAELADEDGFVSPALAWELHRRTGGGLIRPSR